MLLGCELGGEGKMRLFLPTVSLLRNTLTSCFPLPASQVSQRAPSLKFLANSQCFICSMTLQGDPQNLTSCLCKGNGTFTAC